MSETEKVLEFLSFVEDRPQLWRKNHLDFMNREKRKKAFQEISEFTGMPGEKCKKKLKILKDQMREVCRKLPRAPNGQPAFEMGEQVVKWPYYKAMLFMKDQFLGRELQGTYYPEVDVEEISFHESDISGDHQTASNCAPDVIKKRKLDSESDEPSPETSKKPRASEQLLNIDKEKVRTTCIISRSCEAEDEWSAFCNSIAHDLRKLKNPFLAMKTKLDLQRVVNSALHWQLANNGADSTSLLSSEAELPFTE